MNNTCLNLITQLTVELHKDDSKEKLGSGVLYTDRKLSGDVYVLTARHCLVSLEESKVSLRIYNPDIGQYEYVTPVKQRILRHSSEDAGIIIFNKREIASVVSNLPSVHVIDKNFGSYEAVSKGFPAAMLDQTNEYGESRLATIRMTYLQEDPTENVFQLATNDDYSEDTIIGMSGAGIFTEACEELYINGIFIMFSDEERGKVVIAQKLNSFNKLLEENYKNKMSLSCLGHHGLGYKILKNNVECMAKSSE